MPTLLDINKVVTQSWQKPAEKRQIKTSKSIEYIIDYIQNRIYIKETPPKIKLKGIGDKVLILRSGTGSGKSTVLPMALFDAFFENKKRNIIITEPTRATTTEIPNDIVKHNPKMKLGENIGYQTGTIARKPTKGILFTTTGILLQFLRTYTDEQFLRKFSFILLDEVHHRSIDLDLSLFYIKQLLIRNWQSPDCPFVILMSGTFNPDIYMKYFECDRTRFIDVIGSTFATQDIYVKYDLSNYIEYICDLIEKIHIENISDVQTKKKHIDILVFVQGTSQIKLITEKIHRLNAAAFGNLEIAIRHNKETQKKYGGNEPNLYLAPIALMSDNITRGTKEYMDLHSDIDSITVPLYNYADGNKAATFVKDVSVARRIFIGTNAIETGITIPTLGYCIDSGFVKESQFNPNFGCQILVDKNITQANVRQRRGRTGRDAPGIFYACYTEETYRYMPRLPFPELVKEDISSLLLNILINATGTSIKEIDYQRRDEKCFQMNQFNQNWYKLVSESAFDASELDFIQYPSSDSIGYAMEKLHVLGFITNTYTPTIFGIYAAKFRKIPMECIRMILAGYHLGANILDLITISSCIYLAHDIGIKKRNYKPRNPLRVSDDEAFWYYKIVFADEFIEYLFLYNDFMDAVDKINKMVEKANKSNSKISMNYLQEWCEEAGVKYEGMMHMVELRDEIITDMLTIGLNPYYNSLELARGTYNLNSILRRNIQEGLDEVIKIKKCIYEGFRLNVFIYNDISSKYVSQMYHYDASIDSQLVNYISGEYVVQHRPQKIIISKVTMLPNQRDKTIYEFVARDISVLDGFVDIDVEFTSH